MEQAAVGSGVSAVSKTDQKREEKAKACARAQKQKRNTSNFFFFFNPQGLFCVEARPARRYQAPLSSTRRQKLKHSCRFLFFFNQIFPPSSQLLLSLAWFSHVNTPCQYFTELKPSPLSDRADILRASLAPLLLESLKRDKVRVSIITQTENNPRIQTPPYQVNDPPREGHELEGREK